MQPRSHGDSSRKKAILEASSIVTQLKFAPRCGPRPLTLPSARTRTSAFRIARRGLGPAPASVPNMRGRFPCRPAVRPACVKMAASLPRTLLSRFPNLLRSSYGVQVTPGGLSLHPHGVYTFDPRSAARGRGSHSAPVFTSWSCTTLWPHGARVLTLNLRASQSTCPCLLPVPRGRGRWTPPLDMRH